MSHPHFLKFLNHEFVGILSSYKKVSIKEDIDYLFVISGYLENKKETFISKLIEEAKQLENKKVFILGDATSKEVKELENNITIYSSATGEFRNELLNRAKVVISRTGYTTIMDLVELEKKAILFPTPNQTEQEYLAKYHKSLRHFVICENTNNFNLKELTKKLKYTIPIKINKKTKDSIKSIKEMINLHLKKHFFSIVIPAYNEEKYIAKTLEDLNGLDYDKENYEIIVVENGSNDKTYEIIKSYEEKLTNMNVYQSSKGVSKARNLGLSKTNQKSEFTIFLDADTIIKKDFLKKLNNYLTKNSNKNLAIGTTTVKPIKGNRYDKLWYKLYDILHYLTKTSYSIQIAKTDLAKKIQFDELLPYSEDIDFIKRMLSCGNFFFLKTEGVCTSTRRFRKEGYLITTVKWTYQSLTSYNLKINKEYKVVR